MLPQGRVRGSFRFKLLNLARDASQLELFSTQLWPVSGCTQPPELGEELLEKVGPTHTIPCPAYLHYGWIQEGTFYELMDYHHQWLARVARYLTGSRDWDLLFVQAHSGSHVNHLHLNRFDPARRESEGGVQDTTSWFTRHLQSVDGLLGELVSLGDDDTLLVVVADHAGTSSPRGYVDTRAVLEQAGLLVCRVDAQTGRRVPDWPRTKAWAQRSGHVCVNLKGRYPHGIVEPEDYDRVVAEIVEALRGHRHPNTGKRAYTLALTKDEAVPLGLFGDRIGDVVYALRPEPDLEQGREPAPAGAGTPGIRSLLVMAGPDVKEGVQLQRTAHTVCVAPTIAYLMGIPIPRQAEGAILYEALVDPDLRLNLERKAERERDRWKAMYRGLAVEYDLNPQPELIPLSPTAE